MARKSDELPYIDLYIVASRWGWTYGDWLATPSSVLHVLLMYHRYEAWVAKQKEKG